METTENNRFIYEFGKFVLDPQEKTLFLDGKPLHLPAKEFETLLLLVENNGHALSKEEMMMAVWRDSFVEEGNLAKQISRLRKIFNGEVHIETLPKHGYRFSAEVNRIFQPVGETIIEKRTVKRLTVRFEDEMDDAPLALPPKRRSIFRYAWAAILILLLLSLIGLAWFWRENEKPVESNGFSILTDGQFDDTGANWMNQGRIYFRRYINNNRIETWQMNVDGTDQRRANAEIKDLQVGRWSPDEKKVLFTKDSDGRTFYLADANGANEVVLPFIPGNMDWSPDGSQFVYQSKDEKENHQIYLYTLATRENIKLTKTESFGNADPSFSPDGKQIAFVSFHHGNAEIYMMQTDGSNVRRITNHPAFDNYPVFSPDGTKIAFQSNRENERTEIYLQNLENDLPPVRISSFHGETGIAPKCWSADGTEILFKNSGNGKEQIIRAKVEPHRARLILNDENADLTSPRLAPDGKKILYETQLADRRIELRLTDLETKKTSVIYKTAPDYPPRYSLTPAWSPDGNKIAFTEKTSGNSDIFVQNADGSEVRNLTNETLPDTLPTFSPDGTEIIFVRDFYGKGRLYRMDLQGNNQRRLTEKEGYETSPALSPDGLSLAFSGDRQNSDSRGLDVFLLDFQNPNNEKRLTARRFHESSPAFSPDGGKIAFIATSDGNPEIYVQNADGTGLFRLTHTRAEESAPQFSADGKKIIFTANHNGKFAIYEIELP